MNNEASFSHISSPIFNGENYQLWAVRMEAYLEALDLWEAVEEDYEIPPLPTNPTMTQIKSHKERKTKKSKAKACLFAAVSTTVFTRIMSLKSAKDVWDYLKEEYAGDERICGMQSLKKTIVETAANRHAFGFRNCYVIYIWKERKQLKFQLTIKQL